MVVATGNFGRLAFKYEDTYGGTESGNYLDFGYGAKLTGVSSNRNVQAIYNIGSPFGKKLIALQHDGTFGVDGILTNDNLFESIFGKDSKSIDNSGVIEYEPKPHPKSFMTEYAYKGDDDILIRLKGCLIKSASISARVNEPIKYKINCVFQRQKRVNPIDIQESDMEAMDVSETAVPTFVDAELKFMDLDFLVQDFSLNLDLGANVVYGLGSAFTQDMYRGKFVVNGSMTVLAQKADILDLYYSLGWAEIDDTNGTVEFVENQVDMSTVKEGLDAKLTLGINTDGDGNTDKSFEFMVSDVAIDKIGQDLEAGEMVLYNVDFVALSAGARVNI